MLATGPWGISEQEGAELQRAVREAWLAEDVARGLTPFVIELVREAHASLGREMPAVFNALVGAQQEQR